MPSAAPGDLEAVAHRLAAFRQKPVTEALGEVQDALRILDQRAKGLDHPARVRRPGDLMETEESHAGGTEERATGGHALQSKPDRRRVKHPAGMRRIRPENRKNPAVSPGREMEV
jgi:hypothetical protein